MVGIVAVSLHVMTRKHLVLVNKLLSEIMVYTVGKLSFINGALTAVQVVL
jgi:hypothetical protein